MFSIIKGELLMACVKALSTSMSSAAVILPALKIGKWDPINDPPATKAEAAIPTTTTYYNHQIVGKQ
jgi:hypothetical protein